MGMPFAPQTKAGLNPSATSCKFMDFNLANAQSHLLHNLLTGLIAPRPIAWITSMNAAGQLDAAPFSAFNYVGMDPPIVAIGIASRPDADGTAKQTAQNIRSLGEFVINIVNEAVAEAMNMTAIDFPPELKPLEIAKLKMEPSHSVKVPRLADAPASLECREIMTTLIGRNHIVLGQVLAVHVKDEFVDPSGPYIRAEELHAIGRMNGLGAYVKTRDAFLRLPRITYAAWQLPPAKK